MTTAVSERSGVSAVWSSWLKLLDTNLTITTTYNYGLVLQTCRELSSIRKAAQDPDLNGRLLVYPRNQEKKFQPAVQVAFIWTSRNEMVEKGGIRRPAQIFPALQVRSCYEI